MSPPSDPRTDQALVRRAQLGDHDCFAVLLHRHYRAVFAVAIAYLENRADAEDACQNAFVKAHRQLATCRNPDRFRAWLAQIVRNEAHNIAGRSPDRRLTELSPDEHAATTTLPDEGLVNAEHRERVWNALRQLRGAEREVVLLHVLDDLSHSAIARALGISEFMSRRHMSDARRQLRTLLASERQPRESA